MQTDFDNDIQSYFTDMERPRAMFKEFVSAEKLPKRLIVFHGVGGVGKSSLLRMFRLHCRSEKIPVGLASGDDAKSVLDVITRWTEDLKGDGIKFATLSKTLESYRAIQGKVEDQVKKSQNKVMDIASKAASKTAETAGGALLGAAIGSIIPGIGTAIGGALGGVVSGMGAEALTDWLRGFLSKPDIDLLLDPAKKLSADFVEDLAKAAEKKRMVLLLDTFEQMSALEDWVGETAQKIHPNVLVVIAGRKLPDWGRVWQGWMMNAQVEELKPMTEEVMRELIRRYYATMRGGEPDPAQVDAIIKFARGLPMVVTSAVQLWVKYGVEDFQAVKAEIVANLVDRLMEGVPSALIPALEAAAVVRWFDQPILRAVTDKDDVRNVYNELRRFPFVRTRVEGLALHDSVREMMDENLRVQDSEQHAELHERAAAYFEKKLEKVTGDEAERLGLERLYHRVHADEETGMKLFQEMAEKLVNFRLVNRLRAMLNDTNTYQLESNNSILWRNYYNARLWHFEGLFEQAKSTYQAIDENEGIETKLRAYVLCDLGHILRYPQQQSSSKAIETLERIGKLGVKLDPRLATYLLALSGAYRRIGRWDDAYAALEQARTFYEKSGDDYDLAYVYKRIRDQYYNQGHWSKASEVRRKGLDVLLRLEGETPSKAEIYRGFAAGWHWLGFYADVERDLREALRISEKFGGSNLENILTNLGFVSGVQNKFQEAEAFFVNAYKDAEKDGNQSGMAHARASMGFILARSSQLEKGKDGLDTSISMFRSWNDNWGLARYLHLRALLNEKDNYQLANADYIECKRSSFPERKYLYATALTGLVRVKHAQGDITAIPTLLAEAEQLAQQYEYNDHLASLRLTQGHLTSPPTPLLKGEGSLRVLDYYKQAMIYALRYNRFLLDELLSGRPQGTPLHPIIPYCLERGEEGRRILSALRDWWKTGVNDVGTPRPDTISPIPEGIPLLEAEKLARQREPGDGSMQGSVVEQISAVV